MPPDSAEELEIHKTAPGPLVPSNDETDTTARTSPSPSPVVPTLSSPNAPRPVPRPGPPVRRPDAGPARIVPKPGPAPRRPAAPQIEVQRIAAAPEAALDRADEFLDELLDAGRAPGQVLVLTTGGRHPWQQHEESFGAERYWAQLEEAQDVFYADVTGCRPVRREVVILILNGGAPAAVERAEATARDHATSLLVVCGGAR